jgi:hypothetical protein
MPGTALANLEGPEPKCALYEARVLLREPRPDALVLAPSWVHFGPPDHSDCGHRSVNSIRGDKEDSP